ncbi:hypothetical protein CEQ90_04795 [Lewinellaceae bacterium SD302]|nr:hypothetical protein CEQ90_04795 [Lewinellaceae bacterium SD302]
MTQTTQQTQFLEWYRPIHASFLRYCDSHCLGFQQAEDMVQDAILSALEQWDAIENKDRLLAYMIGIVNNRRRNELRSKKVREKFLAERKRIIQVHFPSLPEAALDLHYLLKAMDTLPEAEREALLLFAVSGFSIREVAEIQVATQGSVKTRISRARKRLRELLAEDGRPLTLRQRLQIFTSILL